MTHVSRSLFVLPQNHPQLRGDALFNRSHRALLRCGRVERVPLPARALSPPLRCCAPPQDTRPDHLVPNRLSGEVFGRLHCGKSSALDYICPLSGVQTDRQSMP